MSIGAGVLGAQDKSNAFHNAHFAAIPAFSEPHPFPSRPMFEPEAGKSRAAVGPAAGIAPAKPTAASVAPVAMKVDEWMQDLAAQVSGGEWTRIARQCHQVLDVADQMEHASQFAPVRGLVLPCIS
jgi:hypothetical protein